MQALVDVACDELNYECEKIPLTNPLKVFFGSFDCLSAFT